MAAKIQSEQSEVRGTRSADVFESASPSDLAGRSYPTALGVGHLSPAHSEGCKRAFLTLESVASVHDAMEFITTSKPAIVICNYGMLGDLKSETITRLRQSKVSETLPIVLSSEERLERAKWLSISKISGISELLCSEDKPEIARVLLRAAIRRERPQVILSKEAHRQIEFDPSHFTLQIGDRSAPLRKLDYCLIGGMMDCPEMVWPRTLLSRVMFEPYRRSKGRALDVHVSRVRRYLRQELGVDPIRSVRGIGYALRCPEPGDFTGEQALDQ